MKYEVCIKLVWRVKPFRVSGPHKITFETLLQQSDFEHFFKGCEFYRCSDDGRRIVAFSCPVSLQELPDSRRIVTPPGVFHCKLWEGTWKWLA